MTTNSAKELTYEEISLLEDEANVRGWSRFISNKMFENFTMDEKVKIAANLVAKRFETQYEKRKSSLPANKAVGDALGDTLRNTQMLTNAMLQSIFEELDFPVPKGEIKNFYELVKKSLSDDVEESNGALNQLKSYFDNASPLVIKLLLPFYNAYMKAVKDLSGDLEKAKKDFMGQISFAFVEMQALSLNNIKLSEQELAKLKALPKTKNLSEPQKLLQAGFRDIRSNKGIMDGMADQLEQENITYNATLEKTEEDNFVNKFNKINATYGSEIKKEIEKVKKEVNVKGNGLADSCRELQKDLKEGSSDYKQFDAYVNTFNNSSSNLSNKYILNGKMLTKDIIDEHFKNRVNGRIGGKPLLELATEQGNKKAMKRFIQAGANPYMTIDRYKRDNLTRIGDTINGIFTGRGFKFWNEPPRRTIIEIAKDIIKSKTINKELRKIDKANKKQRTEFVKENIKKINDFLSNRNREYLDNKARDIPEFHANQMDNIYLNAVLNYLKANPTVTAEDQDFVQLIKNALADAKAYEKYFNYNADFKKTENFLEGLSPSFAKSFSFAERNIHEIQKILSYLEKEKLNDAQDRIRNLEINALESVLHYLKQNSTVTENDVKFKEMVKTKLDFLVQKEGSAQYMDNVSISQETKNLFTNLSKSPSIDQTWKKGATAKDEIPSPAITISYARMKPDDMNENNKNVMSQEEKSNFVEQWLQRIDKKIQDLKYSNEIDLKKENPQAIYALNAIKDLLKKLNPEDLKDNPIIERLKKETPDLRADVKSMINQMEEGKLPEPVKKKNLLI